MQPQVLTAALSHQRLSQIRLVATDMDGTLTTAGEFTPALLQSFERLRDCGIAVMIVTGRSLGWVSALVNYLPVVVGAIAENGGIYIDKRSQIPITLPDIPDIAQHRDQLAALFDHLKSRYPHLQPALDNSYRLTDWTFDVAGLSAADLAWMQAACADHNMGFTYSNVQCHLKLAEQNKAAGLQQVMQRQFPQMAAAAVITVGDSLNDESLFNPEQFPHSVGVANIAEYLPILSHRPAYLTTAAAGEGFVELVDYLVSAARPETADPAVLS